MVKSPPKEVVRKENLLTDSVWIVVSQDMTWVYIQSNLLVSIYLFSKVIVRRITPGLASEQTSPSLSPGRRGEG